MRNARYGVHTPHSSSLFSMVNILRQYVMWMDAVNTSKTSLCEMVFCEKPQMLRYVTRVNEWHFTNKSVCDISSAELVIQGRLWIKGRLWIHGRIVRSLSWYGRNLVTFGENCCCHNLNIKIVWYIKIFSLEWNFTRNLSTLSEF